MTKHLDEHRIPFAVGVDGLPRSVGEVERGLACKCTCPSCEAPLIANKGERRLKIWHFSHKANTRCAGALETSLHLAVKDLIEKHKQLLIPPCFVYEFPPDKSLEDHRQEIGEYVHEHYKYTNNAEKHDFWLKRGAGKGVYPKEPKLIAFDSVVLEQTEGSIRPDIVGIAKGRKLYIEVAVTHFIDGEKLRRLRARGTPTIELVVPFETYSKSDWNRLEAWLFTETQGKYWALNTRAELLADADGEKQMRDLKKRKELAKIQSEREARKREQREAYFERQRAAKLRSRIAQEEAEAEETAAKEAAEAQAAHERFEKWTKRREAEDLQQLGLKMIEAEKDNAKWAVARNEEMKRQARLDEVIAQLAGPPSPNLDPTGLPVLFLDYDSAMRPGTGKEETHLQILSNALQGQPCSVVITSMVRQVTTPDDLAALLAPLGGRHVGATPILDPDDSYGTRSEEIRAWLDGHDVSSFCIVDGAKTGVQGEYIWVSTREGLTPEKARQITFSPWHKPRPQRLETEPWQDEDTKLLF